MSAKYPRTSHLPFSPGGTGDDRRLEDVRAFMGRPVVFTEKMDGSNLCLTRENVFARSHNGAPNHPSFDMAKSLHAGLQHILPGGISFFGEWCYAVHSIAYEALPTYFYLFGVRNDAKDSWFSWDEVVMFAEDLGVQTAPFLRNGEFSDPRKFEQLVTSLATSPSVFGSQREGVVVRWAGEFAGSDFEHAVAKWVRKGHIQTDAHWRHEAITRQRLR